MKKSIKCGIAAAVVIAAGIAAYQSYGSYGVQDNSLLMQNIEALASGTEAEADMDASGSTKYLSQLASGVCGYKYDKYEVSVNINGASQKFILGLMPGGKYITEAGAEVSFPNIEWRKRVDGTIRKETGDWKVCVSIESLLDILDTCDRCLQKLCPDPGPGNYCNVDLRIPNNALDVD